MSTNSKYFYKYKKITNRVRQYVIFSLVLTLVLMGTWCVPPKLTEKVIQELKAKYLVERIEEKNS